MMDLESVTFGYDDYCDRCRAPCYSKAYRGTMELLFCAHHIIEYGHGLLEDGWEIVSNAEALEQIGADVPVFA